MSDNSWDTHCHLIEGWDTNKCCGTCHDDAYEWGIEPCNVEIDGKTLFVCCECWEWFGKQNGFEE